jgi:CII-binding regulator of phage lambda lysogenization HflD
MKKIDVHTTCTEILGGRIRSLKLQLRELIEGARNDSKSTAGDKHETSRAMMQIEQEKLTNQLNILLTHEQQLQRIDPSLQHQQIGAGCLTKTDQGWIYVSIPLGRIAVGDQFVMCLSPQSPLGTKLCGKNIGDAIEMNSITYVIESIE